MTTDVDLEKITNEEYFDSLSEMFNSVGWQIMLAELQDSAYSLNDVQTIADEKEFRFRQGQLATIGYLMNFERTLELAEEEQAQEEEGTSSEGP